MLALDELVSRLETRWHSRPPVTRTRMKRAFRKSSRVNAASLLFTHALVELVVDDNIEQRTMNRQPSTVVINETQLPEFVHEEADP